MSITLHCPCGKTLHVGDEHVGGQGQCPACGRLLDIPASDVGPATYPAPADANEAVQAEMPAVSSVRPKLTELSDGDFAESPSGRRNFDEDDELPPHSPGYKLYSAGDVALATFLGSSLGGFVLLSLNYRRLGQRGAAWRLFFIGVVITAVLVGIALASPIGAPVSIAVIYLMYKAAQRLQGEDFDAHVARGGEKALSGHAAGIGLLSGVAIVGLIFGGALLYDFMFTPSLGEKLNFGKDEVYYTRGASVADARRLGEHLRNIGYFDGMRGVTVQVTKPAGSFVVVFCLQKGAWNQAPVIQDFKDIQQQLRQDVFDGHPVEIELCDEVFTVQRTLR